MAEATENHSPAEDRQPVIRKMLQVTSSTRYTEIMDPEDPTATTVVGHSQRQIELDGVLQPSPGLHPISDSFTSIETGFGSLQESLGHEHREFGEACKQATAPYRDRMDTLQADLEDNKLPATFARIETELEAEKQAIRTRLQEVLEANNAGREQRAKLLDEMLELFQE